MKNLIFTMDTYAANVDEISWARIFGINRSGGIVPTTASVVVMAGLN